MAKIIGNVGAIPEIVGETGYIISTRDSEKAAKIVRTAVTTQNSIGKRAKHRIESFFDSQIRESKLRNILDL